MIIKFSDLNIQNGGRGALLKFHAFYHFFFSCFVFFFGTAN
ncbi:unnamed protein product [Diabrotica balteata]|uniref:Uncharacterized protein n=1 Tax=Diabrotica balteata TaxID=107213 RepID=A0A9N9T7J7_DIABA|nr:unnamed protein product [Diabrotica balteata]